MRRAMNWRMDIEREVDFEVESEMDVEAEAEQLKIRNEQAIADKARADSEALEIQSQKALIKAIFRHSRRYQPGSAHIRARCHRGLWNNQFTCNRQLKPEGNK